MRSTFVPTSSAAHSLLICRMNSDTHNFEQLNLDFAAAAPTSENLDQSLVLVTEHNQQPSPVSLNSVFSNNPLGNDTTCLEENCVKL